MEGTIGLVWFTRLPLGKGKAGHLVTSPARPWHQGRGNSPKGESSAIRGANGAKWASWWVKMASLHHFPLQIQRCNLTDTQQWQAVPMILQFCILSEPSFSTEQERGALVVRCPLACMNRHNQVHHPRRSPNEKHYHCNEPSPKGRTKTFCHHVHELEVQVREWGVLIFLSLS